MKLNRITHISLRYNANADIPIELILNLNKRITHFSLLLGYGGFRRSFCKSEIIIPENIKYLSKSYLRKPRVRNNPIYDRYAISSTDFSLSFCKISNPKMSYLVECHLALRIPIAYRPSKLLTFLFLLSSSLLLRSP